jgi:hypothetical protein
MKLFLGNLIELQGKLYTVLSINEHSRTLLVQELHRKTTYRVTLDEVTDNLSISL